MPGNRQKLSQIYRPVGPKYLFTATPTGFAAASFGGSANFAQQIDLSLPLRGLRLVFKGRLVVGTAAFTTTYPESFLNLISEIKLYGTNSRQKGNVTLYDTDLATLWGIQNLMDPNYAASFDISTGGGAATEVAVPTLPWPTWLTLNTGTYDWRIIVDLPFHPFNAPATARPQFLMRQEEWGSSPTLLLNFGTQAGNATGALGVAAATTTCTYSGYGSGSGTPTVDVYGLPMIMGLDLKDTFIPGFMTRISQPVNTILQAAGALQTQILVLQKQPTSRIFLKLGTSLVPNGNPAFATLSDSILTTAGVTLGANRFVRNNVDIFAHKEDSVELYGHPPIQGYTMFDFIGSGNPDGAYPGDQVGDGTVFQINGSVPGTANGYGVIIQEQILYRAEGPLYSF
jgi:hypothetical protein